jgi:hypothetical protein
VIIVVDKKILWEALKEPLRLLVLAVIPFAIAYFTILPYEWAIAITVLLRFIDKWLHELEKAQPVKKQNEGLLGLKGLVGF